MAYFTYILVLSGDYFSGFFTATKPLTKTPSIFRLAQISHTCAGARNHPSLGFGFAAARSPAAKIHGAATAAGSAFAVGNSARGKLGKNKPGKCGWIKGDRISEFFGLQPSYKPIYK